MKRQTQTSCRSLLFGAVLMLCSAISSGVTYYVDASKPAGGNGLSWATAFNTIQAAIDVANPIWFQCYAPYDRIHVKEGTYLITYPLMMGSGDEIYGGFPSSIANPEWADRDWRAYPTIIDGGGGVRCVIIEHYSMVDGFIIQNGRSGSHGGAIYVDTRPIDCGVLGNLTPIVQNCWIRNNSAGYSGGALYDNDSDVYIRDCEFSGNTAAHNGGAIYLLGSGAKIERCLFYNNQTTPSGSLGGGAIAGYKIGDTTGKAAEIINCLFYANVSNSWGGAISGHQMYPTIINCTFTGNTASAFGGAFYGQTNQEAPRIRNSICWGNSPDEISVVTASSYLDVSYSNIQGGWTGPGTNNINSNPLFIGGGNYRLHPSSPCIDTGTNVLAPNNDLDKNPRPIDGNGSGTATTDMGAYEYQLPTPPPPPTSLKAVVISPQIHVTWKDNATDETSYKLQYKRWSYILPEPVSWTTGPTLPANCTSYQHNSATRNYYYKFRVCATNSIGDSAWSNEATVLVGLYVNWIHITHPNGGEKLAVGAVREITWSTSSGIPLVTIDYSTDGGSNWRTPAIAAGTANNGSCLWTVPNTLSNNCILRVRNTADGSLYDLSNFPFSIVPAAPDLAVKSVTLTPQTPIRGQPCTVDIVVTNQGSVATSTYFYVDWFPHRDTPPTVGMYSDIFGSIVSLTAGESKTVTLNTPYNSPGHFSGYVVLDTTQRIAEADEDNNVVGPRAVEVIVKGSMLAFDTKEDAVQSSVRWFGGDNRPGFTRNLGAGQSFIPVREAKVQSVAFHFDRRFDYFQNPTGYGHAVRLYLNVRDSAGTILRTVYTDVPASFNGGWITFTFGATDLWLNADDLYIFTCYLYDGENEKYWSGITANSSNPWPLCNGYLSEVSGSPANMQTWANWTASSTWDFNFHITGQYVEPYPGDLNSDWKVGIDDVVILAGDWLRNDCLMLDWCDGCDINWSKKVDLADFAVVAAYWKKSFPPPAYNDLDRAAIAKIYQHGHLSSADISGSDDSAFNPGTYFVYRTSQGRLGKFIVENWEPASGNRLTIAWVTYNANGTVYSSGTGLVIRGTFSCDLDTGAETSTGADFWWNMQTSTVRYLTPRNGALFKLIYRAP